MEYFNLHDIVKGYYERRKETKTTIVSTLSLTAVSLVFAIRTRRRLFGGGISLTIINFSIYLKY